MRAALGVIAAAVVFASGCAQKDWIDRTLVTERHGRVGRILRGRQFVPRAAPGSTTGGVKGHWIRHNTPLGYGWYHSAPGEHVG